MKRAKNEDDLNNCTIYWRGQLATSADVGDDETLLDYLKRLVKELEPLWSK